MKIGDKVVLDGIDDVYTIKEIQEDRRRAVVVSVYTGRHEKYYLDDLRKTVKTPIMFLETYGHEWRDVVNEVLSKNKVRFREVPVERQRDLTRFWVDAKKVTAAKRCLDQHYEDEKAGKLVPKVFPPVETVTVDEDIPF